MAIAIISIVTIIPVCIKVNNENYLLNFNNKNARRRYEPVQNQQERH